MPDHRDEIKQKQDIFPWYKRDARAVYEGTRALSLEARGAYTDILDLIYIHGGPLPDDAKWISHALFISTRKWKPLRDELIVAGKIEISNGKISNSRATIELEKRANQRRTEVGSRPVRPPLNNEPTSNQPRLELENSEKPNKINESTQKTARDTRAFLESEVEEEEKKEEIEKKIDRSILSLDDFVKEIWAATDGRMIDDHDDPTALIRSWLKAGAEQSDILETIRTVAAHKRHESIDHFGFFQKSVFEAIADRKSGRPNRHKPPPPPETQAEYFKRRIAEDMARELAEGLTHGTA